MHRTAIPTINPTLIRIMIVDAAEAAADVAEVPRLVLVRRAVKPGAAHGCGAAAKSFWRVFDQPRFERTNLKTTRNIQIQTGAKLCMT